MLPTITYTLHISVCFCLGLIFWYYKGDDSGRGSTYRAFLRILAVICLISGAVSAVLLYLHASGIDETFIYGFISPFFFIFVTGLYFRPFLLNLRSNTKQVQWQDGLACVFVALGLAHPLLFFQYQVSSYSQFIPNIPTYNEFLQSPECEMLTTIVFIVGALYLMLSIYNTLRHLRIILLWDRQNKGKHVFTLTIRLFFFLFFAFLLMIGDWWLFEYYDLPYYVDLPVWSAFALVAAIEILNCKQEYTRLEHEAIRLHIEFVGARMFYQKSALELNDEENIHRREQAVVLHAISDWAERSDKPFLNENLTISSLSEEIGIPEMIIIRYLNSSYGLSFDEFICYLNSKAS